MRFYQNQKKDVRLVGNIGNPILSLKKKKKQFLLLKHHLIN